jgi:RNA polymerase sigma factor (TIGR02999 family)
MSATPNDVTQLLQAWRAGEPGVEESLFPLVYDELRRIATRYLRREREGHTLQPTALVHEAYIRLIDQTRADWQNRAQFYGVAATMMRRILVNHARDQAAGKRGGGAQKISLDEVNISLEQKATQLVSLDEALSKLAQVDPRKERVVELIYFAGLDQKEAAEVLKVSEKTIQRDWQMAKLWLLRELSIS